MTREEFKEELMNNDIDPSIVHFDDSLSEGYCFRQNYFRWETFIRERGTEYDLVGYPSESSALESLLAELINIYGK